jgi:hypothetical protein
LTRARRSSYGITVPTLSFKVTPREAARIRSLARRERRTVSEFLRRRATEPARASGPTAGYRIERSRVTGLPVMTAPAETPPVTDEQVRALLVDFP